MTTRRFSRSDGPAARVSAQFHVVLAQAAHNDVLAGFVASYRELLVARGPSLEQVDGLPRVGTRRASGLYDAVHSAMRSSRPPGWPTTSIR